MYFGAHVSASGGIDKAIERVAELGAEAVQVFTQSPRMWRPVNHKPANVERWHALRAEHGINHAVAHAIYLINIASDDPEIYEKSVTALENTMVAVELLGLDAVVFHPGSHRSAGLDGCLDRMAAAMTRVLETSETTWLLMENSAGQGGTIGRDIEELARVFEAVGPHPRLGVCLDSCHWFVSGVDVRERLALDAALGELDSAIGLDRLQALHLNDSKTALGSNRDRHDNIGAGEIGEGLATFLSHPAFQELAVYLEVPGEGDGPTAGEVERARALHAAGLAAAS